MTDPPAGSVLLPDMDGSICVCMAYIDASQRLRWLLINKYSLYAFRLHMHSMAQNGLFSFLWLQVANIPSEGSIRLYKA